MPLFTETRPTYVTIIGWLAILFGVVMAVNGILAATHDALVYRVPGTPEEWKGRFPLTEFSNRHQLIFIAAGGCLGVIATVDGVWFLWLRACGRTTLEAIAWLVMLWIICAMIELQVGGSSIGLNGGSAPFSLLPRIIHGVMIVATVGLPVALILRYLRSSKCRDAIRIAEAERAKGGDNE
ncbi:MAG: hypothetical protein HZA91_02505 [Verrucomicrobia bacterium]|nr:hypothetical protein [Verrucomicrobiota bacterium]